jgi:hypothetical protein
MTSMRNAVIAVVVSSLLVFQCSEETLNVTITQPADGAEVSGIVRVEAETSNNAIIVVFYVDEASIDTCRAAPFMCCWNTFAHPDSSSHHLYAIARDRKGDELCSDSVLVFVNNGDMIFADDFETYSPNSYPYTGGWFEIWAGAGSNHTYVNDQVSYSGAQSFRLRGLGDWPRTDGVELDLSGIQQLTYEINIMVPSQDSAGAVFGFFALIDPTSGMICNGVLFEHSDGLIYAHGAIEESTGHVWLRDTWYSVRVLLDYVGLSMSVWLGDEQIVFNLPAVPREWADTFAIATEYGAPGIVYYDDVKVFQHE